MDGQSNRNQPCYAVFNVPSTSVMDLSPPSVEQDAPSNEDAPSTPSQNMAGLLSKSHAPQYMILFDGLRRQISQYIAIRVVLDLGPSTRRVQLGGGRDHKGTWFQRATIRNPIARCPASQTHVVGNQLVR
jgi:hypothetical protein